MSDEPKLRKRLIQGTLLLVALAFVLYVREKVFFDRSHYKDGKLECRFDRQWFQVTPQMRGRLWCYHPSGKRKLVANYDSGGSLHGMQIAYAEDGKIIDQWEYVHGNPVDGYRMAYWPNGNPRLSIERREGKLTSTAKACHWCKMPIQADATVCPACKRNQP